MILGEEVEGEQRCIRVWVPPGRLPPPVVEDFMWRVRNVRPTSTPHTLHFTGGYFLAPTLTTHLLSSSSNTVAVALRVPLTVTPDILIGASILQRTEEF